VDAPRISSGSAGRRQRYSGFGSSHRNAKLSRRLRKALVTMLIMALVVPTGGMAYEAIGRLLDARRFPMQGQMVDIGGYSLNINCAGKGAPTVILESGLGEHARSRVEVQSGVEPRSSLQIARELHALLNKTALRRNLGFSHIKPLS
jgi:hypothetical protein